MNTSQLAREKFEGTKPLHHKVILWTLKKYGPATNYGIAKNAYYVGKDSNGRDRTYKLSYHQVARRTGELCSMYKIASLGPKLDDDGAMRYEYIAL